MNEPILCVAQGQQGERKSMDITIENLRILLGWSAVVNMGILIAWWLAFVFAREMIFKMHTRWFKISEERFNEMHYTMMGYYKLAMILLTVVPYLVLRMADFN